jgi:hypothetical protein
VTGVLVVLLLCGLGILALLWTGTLFAQGYIYEEATEGLPWRAVAGAGVIAGFLGIWTLLEYSTPNRYDTIFSFSTEETIALDEFWSVRRNADGEKEIHFKKRVRPDGRVDYVDSDFQRWQRSSSGMMVAIRYVRGEETVRLEAELTPDGSQFAPRVVRGITMPLRYLEVGGSRYMSEDQLGRVTMNRRGLLVINIVLNLLHFVVWFAVLWLLLRFQWQHALGFAAAYWLVATLIIAPMLFARARKAAETRNASAAPVASHQILVPNRLDGEA